MCRVGHKTLTQLISDTSEFAVLRFTCMTAEKYVCYYYYSCYYSVHIAIRL